MLEKRVELMISTYLHVDEAAQQQIRDSFSLPDDLLSDMIEDETIDDTQKLRDIF